MEKEVLLSEFLERLSRDLNNINDICVSLRQTHAAQLKRANITNKIQAVLRLTGDIKYRLNLV
tara:strand:- start:517 stop:705 length:189 start_codon:yes stop_codon:yes gene_type:complete